MAWMIVQCTLYLTFSFKKGINLWANFEWKLFKWNLFVQLMQIFGHPYFPQNSKTDSLNKLLISTGLFSPRSIFHIPYSKYQNDKIHFNYTKMRDHYHQPNKNAQFAQECPPLVNAKSTKLLSFMFYAQTENVLYNEDAINVIRWRLKQLNWIKMSCELFWYTHTTAFTLYTLAPGTGPQAISLIKSMK